MNLTLDLVSGYNVLLNPIFDVVYPNNYSGAVGRGVASGGGRLSALMYLKHGRSKRER